MHIIGITFTLLFGLHGACTYRLTNQRHQIIQDIRDINSECIVNKSFNCGNNIKPMHRKIKHLHKLGIKLSFIYLQLNLSDVFKRRGPNMIHILMQQMLTYKTVDSWCNPQDHLPTTAFGRYKLCAKIEGCFASLYNIGDFRPCGSLYLLNHHLLRFNNIFKITVHHLFFIRVYMKKIDLCVMEYNNSLSLYSVLTKQVLRRLYGRHPPCHIDINYSQVNIELRFVVYRCKTVINLQYSVIDLLVSSYKFYISCGITISLVQMLHTLHKVALYFQCMALSV